MTGLVGAKAAAPVRLDFAGGWTDVPPFSTREGGAVVSATIGLFARAEVQPRSDAFHLVAQELGAELVLTDPHAAVADPRLALHGAALRLFRPSTQLSLSTRSDVPPGSGLGSSGAIDVALVAALSRAMGEPLEPLTCAHRAWRLEAVELGMPGGKQDQYSAALGGFNLMYFDDPEVRVIRLELEQDFLAELARRTVLCYTGASRLSGNTIARVIAAYERGDGGVVNAFRTMREVALETVEALQQGNIFLLSTLLERNWLAQQQLDPGMRTAEMAQLERAMKAAGALGGKAAGSGAGGCMFFIAGDDVAAARAAATRCGAQVLPVAWTDSGVQPC